MIDHVSGVWFISKLILLAQYSLVVLNLLLKTPFISICNTTSWDFARLCFNIVGQQEGLAAAFNFTLKPPTICIYHYVMTTQLIGVGHLSFRVLRYWPYALLLMMMMLMIVCATMTSPHYPHLWLTLSGRHPQRLFLSILASSPATAARSAPSLEAHFSDCQYVKTSALCDSAGIYVPALLAGRGESSTKYGHRKSLSYKLISERRNRQFQGKRV